MRRLCLAAVAASIATASLAQTGSNVVEPRGQGQVDSLNQSILIQQQNRAAAQQNQFEVNSLRSEIGRNPAPYTPPPIGGVGAGVRIR